MTKPHTLPLISVSCGNSFSYGCGRNDPALLIWIHNAEQECFPHPLL